MAGFIRFEVMGYREVDGRLAKRTPHLQAVKREEMRAMGRDLMGYLRAEAPKKSGKFAQGINYLTVEKGSETVLTFYVKGDHAFLLPFITKGTKPHIIPTGGAAAQMAKGYPLRFFWPNGPQGPKIYYFWSVRHPGTKPNDFVGRVLDSHREEVRLRLNRVARRVAWLV